MAAASSWDRWAALFDEAGYAPVSPGWPDDPDTVDEANANPEVFEREQHNAGVTEFAEITGRGHALVIDSGWREIAQTALDFIRRFTQEEASPPQSG